jgi:LysM repeat protein
MRIRRWYRFVLAAALMLVVALSSAPVHAEGQTHVVQPGENLFRIALRYGLTVDALAAANGITDPTHIYVGQVLKIPDGTAPQQPAPDNPAPQANPPANNAPPANSAPANAAPPATNGLVYYTVQVGDTLASIAQRFGVNWTDIARANNITDPNHIVRGQQLIIPGAAATGGATAPNPPGEPPDAPPPTAVPPAPAQPAAPPADGTRTHVVQPGEGLASIGKQYGVSWPTIAAANGITDPNTIYAGMVLKIPASDSSVTNMENSMGVPPGPNPPATTGKSIVVILRQQRVYAYENGNLVRNVLVSTGLPGTPTVQGDFTIYLKYRAQLMTGDDYYLPGVPWVMYFYQGYSFHGTYWHHNWGHPMSHGCVNMPTPEALWLYTWAEIGTPVHVQW